MQKPHRSEALDRLRMKSPFTGRGPAIDLRQLAIILSGRGRLPGKSMSPKIALAALLLAALPLAGLADDSSSDASNVAVEKNRDSRSQKSKRDSSDITLSKAERSAEREERRQERRRHKEHRHHGGKGGGKGGPNPSPDD